MISVRDLIREFPATFMTISCWCWRLGIACLLIANKCYSCCLSCNDFDLLSTRFVKTILPGSVFSACLNYCQQLDSTGLPEEAVTSIYCLYVVCRWVVNTSAFYSVDPRFISVFVVLPAPSRAMLTLHFKIRRHRMVAHFFFFDFSFTQSLADLTLSNSWNVL